MWRAKGVFPTGVSGHGLLGCYSAAYVAGAISLEYCMALCCERVRLEEQSAKGCDSSMTLALFDHLQHTNPGCSLFSGDINNAVLTAWDGGVHNFIDFDPAGALTALGQAAVLEHRGGDIREGLWRSGASFLSLGESLIRPRNVHIKDPGIRYYSISFYYHFLIFHS